MPGSTDPCSTSQPGVVLGVPLSSLSSRWLPLQASRHAITNQVAPSTLVWKPNPMTQGLAKSPSQVTLCHSIDPIGLHAIARFYVMAFTSLLVGFQFQASSEHPAEEEQCPLFPLAIHVDFCFSLKITPTRRSIFLNTSKPCGKCGGLWLLWVPS